MTPTYTPAQIGFGAAMTPDSSWAANISAMETGIGRHLDLVLDWGNWDTTTGWATPTFLGAIGNRPLLWTIQPQADVDWQQMIAGAYDAQIISFANWVNENYMAAQTMYVRFAHEMNGTGWYPWQVGGACGVTSAADYAEGFNHVASVLKAHSDKIRMVWCAQAGYKNFASFYDSSADIIGFDSYNYDAANAWYSEATTFGPLSTPPIFDPYGQCAALDPYKPVWCCETACQDVAAFTYDSVQYGPFSGVTKSGWVEAFFSSTAYPRLAAVCWFNISKERAWNWDSSTDSKTGFTTAFSAFTSSTGSAVWDPATGGFDPDFVTTTALVNGAATVTLAERFGYVEFQNQSATDVMWVRTDGVAPVAGADGSYYIGPGETTILANGLPMWWQGFSPMGAANPGTTIKIVGTGTDSFTVTGR